MFILTTSIYTHVHLKLKLTVLALELNKLGAAGGTVAVFAIGYGLLKGMFDIIRKSIDAEGETNPDRGKLELAIELELLLLLLLTLLMLNSFSCGTGDAPEKHIYIPTKKMQNYSCKLN